MLTLLYNAKVVLPCSVKQGFVIVRDDTIEAVGEGREYPQLPYDRTVDLKQNYLAPGFIEMHTHGAAGAGFTDGTPEAFAAISSMHLRHGTTTLLPTLESTSFEKIMRCIDVFRDAQKQLSGKSLHLLGLHMEGPYLSTRQLGGMDPAYVRDPDPNEYEKILSAGRGLICRWTLAPELDGAKPLIDRLRGEGIKLAIAHSNAEYSEVLDAYNHGVTHVTHLYSAMSTITRRSGFRHSGVIESAFCIEDMTVELIADGCHLPDELLRMVYRFKGPERTALVCDSMRAAGVASPGSTVEAWNGMRVIIEDGVAKLPDRSVFAGSIALDDRLVRVMYKKVGLPLYDAVRMMTLTPAALTGIDGLTGSIEVGKIADLVCFDDDINVQSVMVSGQQLVG